jgi:UDP-N-acetylmuramate dehydrogenase
MTVPPLDIEGLRLTEDVPLAARTTLRIGGRARFLAEVGTVEALRTLLVWASGENLPLLPIGKGSNLLVPDEGFAGLVLLLGGDFRQCSVDGERVVAGAGVSLVTLAKAARDAGLSGLEGLSGIPSSLGGAIRINAGAYGTELFDLLVSVDLVTRRGGSRSVPASGIPHGYRWTSLMDADDLITGGVLLLRPSPREEIERRTAEVAEKRAGALPREPNAGSIFKNPPSDFAGRLLEVCGMKGKRAGLAQVSERHANVIVNLGGASERDVRELMIEMRRAVKARFGVVLVPEVELVGGPLPPIEATVSSVESGE